MYLVDYNHNKRQERQERIYEALSRTVIKYGEGGKGYQKYNRIREFWNYDDPYPTLRYITTNIRVKTIKWFIHHKIKIDDPIWNGDFLHGITIHGKIKWNTKNFPTFFWSYSDIISKIIRMSPFGGRITENNKDCYNKWIAAPSLYLGYSEESLPFMAGAMAGASLWENDGVNYARFNKGALPYLNKWGIPIEKELDGRPKAYKIYLTSPIWPAIFSPMMPKEVGDRWLNLKNTCNAEIYAFILWNVYVGSVFSRGEIPYLRSRRKMFNDFKDEEGAMRKLEKMRMEKGLTQLDNRIRDMIKNWAKK